MHKNSEESQILGGPKHGINQTLPVGVIVLSLILRLVEYQYFQIFGKVFDNLLGQNES